MAIAKHRIERLLDANVNRASEGIRVVEESVRFVRNNALLYKQLRRVRHQLNLVTARFFPRLVGSRQSETDVGRLIRERERTSLNEVLVANMKRSQEAMRVLEEVGKIFSQSAAREFKQMRYQLYILEKKLWEKL